jgi:triphosphatase
MYRRVVRDVDVAHARRRHALRIRVKRLRYGCEFFAPCFPPQAVQPYAKALRGLQDLLGELNDIAVARRLLRKMGREVPPGLERREKRLNGKLRAAWEGFEKQRPYWRPAA